MTSVTCEVEDYREEGGFIEVRVSGHNLPAGIVPDLAAWAVSLELGIDMDELPTPRDCITEGAGYFVSYEL